MTNEEKEYEDLIKEDFKNFLYIVWEKLNLPEPSRVQYDIADYLQNGESRKMIQAMRGAGKSYITSAYAAWCLYRNPDTTIICISAVQNRAREFIRLTRKILDSIDFLEHLIPDVNDRDGADRFDVGCRSTPDKNPSVAAYGIKSMITGSHSDIIICDDVEIPQNSNTVESREILSQRVKELESVLNPNGSIIFLGTPQSFDSIYRLLERSYPVRKWTARYPDPDSTQAENLAPTLLEDISLGRAHIGDPTYPTYYSNDVLLQREAIMGSSNFQLQMMLDTSLADENKFPLRISNLIVHPVSPHGASTKIMWGTLNPANIESPSTHANDKFFLPIHHDTSIKEYTHVIAAIDPSGRGKDGTALAILAELNGILHLGHISVFQDGYSSETMERISNILFHWGVNKVVIESNFGDGIWTKLLIPILKRPVEIKEYRATGQKELRILDALQPLTENHRLVIDPSVAKNESFGFQYTRLSRDRGSLKHDDIIDAIAIGVEDLKEYVAVDPTTMARRKAEKEQQKEIKDFLTAFKKQERNVGEREGRHSFTSMNRSPRSSRGWGRMPR
jgi:hypothetical protein